MEMIPDEHVKRQMHNAFTPYILIMSLTEWHINIYNQAIGDDNAKIHPIP